MKSDRGLRYFGVGDPTFDFRDFRIREQGRVRCNRIHVATLINFECERDCVPARKPFGVMRWRHIAELSAAIEACGLSLINLCVWNKTNGGMGSLYRSKHELVFVAKKGAASHVNNVQLGRHGRYRTNVWDYAGVNSFGASRMEDLADHPTVKPVSLVADAIRDVTAKGDLVIDGFIGSGTTILAAERTKRIAYGIEIEPGYVDVAIRRWEKLTGEVAVLEQTGQRFAEVAAERSAASDAAAA